LHLDKFNEQVGNEGAPYLDLNRIFIVSQEVFEREVLFDPFKQDLDLPSFSIKISYL
jgi:hypothetical protein